jgi:hypothetical protein
VSIILYSNKGPQVVKFRMQSDSRGRGAGRGHSSREEALKEGSIVMGTSKSTMFWLFGEIRVTDEDHKVLYTPPSFSFFLPNRLLPLKGLAAFASTASNSFSML